MSGFTWLPEFIARLENEHVILDETRSMQTWTPVQRLPLDAEDWATVAKVAAAVGLRHAGVWGDQIDAAIYVYACLAMEGDYLTLETSVPLQQPALASHTPYFPGLDRMERHLHDMLGIRFLDHPDPRRWTRHQAWNEDEFPLRDEFPLAGRSPKRVPADSSYPFHEVSGSGVYQIPVGPVHAGIIEPGHFRFQAVGETVLALEERLGYVHKGIEKIAVGRDREGLARLAGRVSGDSTVAHTWAACMAMERASGIEPPLRALMIRAVLAERERIANHLGDIGAICNDVGFAFVHMQFSRLREDWTRGNLSVFGHRLLMDRIVPGGVCCNLDEVSIIQLRQQHAALELELDELLPRLDEQPSLEDRLVSTGVLSLPEARRLGVVGHVGKASGVDYDLRRDQRYAPYDRLTVISPCLQEGDVAARLQVRAEEIRHSLALLDELLRLLPDGSIQTTWPTTAVVGQGMGLVEGWRGEILCYLRFDANGRVARYFPRDPSWFHWPALEQLIMGNIVPDFPVCNKSVNGSYSGQDG